MIMHEKKCGRTTVSWGPATMKPARAMTAELRFSLELKAEVFEIHSSAG